MTERPDRPDLRELLGEGVPEEELARLRRVDELLRTTPPPPEVPDLLAARVLAIPAGRRGSRRRLLAAVAAAAALAGGTFAIGFLTGGDDLPSPLERIELAATPLAPQAGMSIEIFPIDAAGNWGMVADAWGLEPLPEGGYYELWLTMDARPVASCGRFVVNAAGAAEGLWLNAPYRFRNYDRWVVTRHEPDGEESGPLLDGPVVVPA